MKNHLLFASCLVIVLSLTAAAVKMGTGLSATTLNTLAPPVFGTLNTSLSVYFTNAPLSSATNVAAPQGYYGVVLLRNNWGPNFKVSFNSMPIAFVTFANGATKSYNVLFNAATANWNAGESGAGRFGPDEDANKLDPANIKSVRIAYNVNTGATFVRSRVFIP